MKLGDDIKGIAARFSDQSGLARTLTRWSVGAAVAIVALRDLTPSSGQAYGLFASLASSLRSSFACLPRAPIWLAALGVATGLIGIRLSARAAALEEYRKREEGWLRQHEAWLREHHPSVSDDPSDKEDLAMAIAADAGSASARAAQLALSIVAAFWAVVTGCSVALFVVYLVHAGHTNNILFWLAAGALSWLVRHVETLMTDRRWKRMQPRPEPPSKEEAEERLLVYQVKYSSKTGRLDRSGMPLLYAYSRLDFEEFRSELAQHGVSGIVPKIGLFYLTSWVIILYPFFHMATPAFSQSADFAQCTFVNAHEFFGVARANAWPYLVLGSLSLLIIPYVIRSRYMAFMNEWSFPAAVKMSVLQRDAASIGRMAIYQVPGAIVQATLVCFVLWLSVAIADQTRNVYWGLIILFFPIFISGILLSRWMRAKARKRRT